MTFRFNVNEQAVYSLRNGQVIKLVPFKGEALRADDERPPTHEQVMAAAERHVKLLNTAAKAVDWYLDDREAVLRNANLSVIGRTEALRKPALTMVGHIASAYAAAAQLLAIAHADRQKLYAVPAPNGVIEIQRDAEVRVWWRTLDIAQRAQVVQDAYQSPTGRDMLRAVLTSPLPTEGHDPMVAQTWERSVRSVRPVEAMRVAVEQEAAEWVCNAIKMVATHAINVAGINNTRALELVLTDDPAGAGALAFGTEADVRRALVTFKGRKAA